MKKTEIAFIVMSIPSVLFTYMSIGAAGVLQGAAAALIIGLLIGALIKVFKELTK